MKNIIFAMRELFLNPRTSEFWVTGTPMIAVQLLGRLLGPQVFPPELAASLQNFLDVLLTLMLAGSTRVVSKTAKGPVKVAP